MVDADLPEPCDQNPHASTPPCIHQGEQQQAMFLHMHVSQPCMQAAHGQGPLWNLHEKKKKQGKKAQAIGLLGLLIVFASERTNDSIDSWVSSNLVSGSGRWWDDAGVGLARPWHVPKHQLYQRYPSGSLHCGKAASGFLSFAADVEWLVSIRDA